MMSPVAWARENAGVYFGNATAVRDFRVQLRGNRAVALWTAYLLVLIGFALAVYASAAEFGQISVVDAQDKLRGFYQYVMILLATMVMLVAPALTSTSVVLERQRRSLDLLFSAPVSPKYFLVGKMLSSYRYTWMLLVLSLPVTAACVVLGGAAWSDVIASYLLLSIHALIFTSVALVISTVSPRPMSAIIYSYAAAGTYVIVSGFATPALMTPRGFGTSGMEAHFSVTLNPFLVVQSAGTYTVLWGLSVPNWAFALVFALLVSKLMLLGAASVLSPYGAAETKSLRIHGLAYYFALAVAIAWPAASGAPLAEIGYAAGLTLGWILVLSSLLFAFVTCFGTDLERKFWPDGMFSIPNAIKGTPSGALPYLLMVVGATALGAVAGTYMGANQLPGPVFLAYLAWTVGYVLFGWSLGRLSSSFVAGLRPARTMHVAMLIFVFVLPAPLIASQDLQRGTDHVLWNVYPLYPLFGGYEKAALAAIFGAIMGAAGVAIAALAEMWTRARFSSWRLAHE